MENYRVKELELDTEYKYYSYSKNNKLILDDFIPLNEQIIFRTKYNDDISTKSIFFIYQLIYNENLGYFARLFYNKKDIEKSSSNLSRLFEDSLPEYKYHNEIISNETNSNNDGTIDLEDIIALLDSKYPNILFGG